MEHTTILWARLKYLTIVQLIVSRRCSIISNGKTTNMMTQRHSNSSMCVFLVQFAASSSGKKRRPCVVGIECQTEQIDTSFSLDEMAQHFSSRGLSSDDLVILSGNHLFVHLQLRRASLLSTRPLSHLRKFLALGAHTIGSAHAALSMSASRKTLREILSLLMPTWTRTTRWSSSNNDGFPVQQPVLSKSLPWRLVWRYIDE